MKTGMGVLMDQKSIADEFNRYFSSQVEAVEDGDNSAACSFPARDHQFKFKKVEEDDVLRLLRGLDVNSSMT